MRFGDENPHAAMFYGVPLNPAAAADKAWIGTIINMPWIAGTLKGLSGFENAVPLFFNKEGRYIIFPSGRSLNDGPQSFSDEARKYKAPACACWNGEFWRVSRAKRSLPPCLAAMPRPGLCPGRAPPRWPITP